MVVSAASSLYRYSLGGIPSAIDLADLFFGPDKRWLPPTAAIAVSIVTIAAVLAVSGAVFWHLRGLDGHHTSSSGEEAVGGVPEALRENVGL